MEPNVNNEQEMALIKGNEVVADLQVSKFPRGHKTFHRSGDSAGSVNGSTSDRLLEAEIKQRSRNHPMHSNNIHPNDDDSNIPWRDRFPTPTLPTHRLPQTSRNEINHDLDDDDEKQYLQEVNARFHQQQVLQQQEDDDVRSVLAMKKDLIHVELRKIMALMEVYHDHAKRLSFWDSITKTTVTGASALAAIGLYIGVDQTNTELNQIMYYISLSCSTVATVLGQLTNSWNLSERAHNNTTTYRGLHNLHDFVSFQLVRNHLSSTQIDQILSDIQTRLLLIRDSAERGTYQPRALQPAGTVHG